MSAKTRHLALVLLVLTALAPRLALAGSAADPALVRDATGQLTAYAAAETQPIWTYAALRVDAVLEAERSALYVAGTVRDARTANLIVARLDLATGHELWRNDLAMPQPESSVGAVRGFVSDGAVVVWAGTNQRTVALSSETGTQLWAAAESWLLDRPESSGEGPVYLLDRTQTIHARDGLSGAMLWAFPIGEVAEATKVLSLFDADGMVVAA